MFARRIVMYLFLALALISQTATAFGEGQVSITDQLLNEYSSLERLTASLTPDGLVGGYLYYKNFGDHLLIWDADTFEEDGHHMIRVFVPKDEATGQAAFSISYYRSNYLLQGQTTLRRFIGPEDSGWRADTISLSEVKYLGYQGNQKPTFNALETDLLLFYGIQTFP
jgi:hypothetical protein